MAWTLQLAEAGERQAPCPPPATPPTSCSGSRCAPPLRLKTRVARAHFVSENPFAFRQPSGPSPLCHAAAGSAAGLQPASRGIGPQLRASRDIGIRIPFFSRHRHIASAPLETSAYRFRAFREIGPQLRAWSWRRVAPGLAAVCGVMPHLTGFQPYGALRRRGAWREARWQVPSQISERHWVKRAVALFCGLKY